MNIEEIKVEAGKCGSVPHFHLCWYVSDEWIGQEILVGVNEDTIRDLFGIKEDFPEFLVVTAKHRERLQACVKHNIDLNLADYTVEYLFIWRNEI